MRKTTILRLITGAAFAAVITAGVAGPAGAKEEAAAKAAETTPFDPASVDSFGGAYLAAFSADVDGDYPMAVELYKTALLFEPDNIALKERLMINLLLNGDFDEGVAAARELKDDEAVDRITSIILGLDAIRDGDTKAAKAFFDYPGTNDLDRLMNGLLSAWATFSDGDEKKAIDSVMALKGPEWFGIFKNYTAGMMALVNGDKDDARRYLTDVIADRNGGATAQDTLLRAVMALATMEADAGNKQKALDAVSAGEALTGQYAPFDAIRSDIENGAVPRQEVRDANEGAASVLFAISSALNQSAGGNGGQRTGAEEIVSIHLQAARALDPDASDTLMLLGNISDTLDKTDRAIEFYKSINKDAPVFRLSELQLGLDLAQSGKDEDAKAHLKALIDEDPQDFRAYLAYGSVLSQAEDYRAMAENFDAAARAIGPAPTRAHWGIFYQRGIAYERLKEWDKAEPNFREALKLYPDQPQVLNYLGYSLIDMNLNLKEGMDMVSKAAELRPNDGYIVDSLGWAHYKLGQYDEAVTQLERAVSLKESDPTINDHLGDAYWRVGRKLEATFQWKRALVEKSDDVDPLKIQEKLKVGLPPAKAQLPNGADAKAKVDEKS